MVHRKYTVAIVLLFVAQFVFAQASPSEADVEKRVESILSQMTLEEKIEMIGGTHEWASCPFRRSEYTMPARTRTGVPASSSQPLFRLAKGFNQIVRNRACAPSIMPWSRIVHPETEESAHLKPHQSLARARSRRKRSKSIRCSNRLPWSLLKTGLS